MKVIGRLDQKSACKALACPAILRGENGDILIIGTDVTNQIENLADFQAGCAPHERIVKIPANVFNSAKNIK